MLNDLHPELVIPATLLIAGGVLAAYGAYKLIRRWFVVKIRMPLIRRFRYRPARPSKEHYRIDS